MKCTDCESDTVGGYRLCGPCLTRAVERARAPRLNPPDSEACPCCEHATRGTLPGSPCHTCGVISHYSDVSNFERKNKP